jgi:hypothetical protein
MPIKILLVCFVPKVALEEKEEQAIIELVRSYGAIKRFSVFQNDLVFKAFVEPASEIAYSVILNDLADKYFDFGHMKVFPSKKRKIVAIGPISNAKGNKAETANVTAGAERNIRNQEKLTALENNHDIIKDIYSSQIHEINSCSLGSKMFCQQNLQLNATRHEENFFSSDLSIKILPNIDYIDIKRDFEKLGCSKGNENPKKDHKCSTYLMVVCEIPGIISPRMIENLFGTLGNIVMIVSSKRDDLFIIEYERSSASKIAFDLLNNFCLLKCQLHLEVMTPTKFNVLVTEYSHSHKLTFHQIEPEKHRFHSISTVKLNPVSRVLCFSHLCYELSLVVLVNLISQISEPAKIVRLNKRQSQSFLYLVYFEQRQNAAEVLSVMHGKWVGNSRITVAFSHPADI